MNLSGQVLDTTGKLRCYDTPFWEIMTSTDFYSLLLFTGIVLCMMHLWSYNYYPREWVELSPRGKAKDSRPKQSEQEGDQRSRRIRLTFIRSQSLQSQCRLVETGVAQSGALSCLSVSIMKTNLLNGWMSVYRWMQNFYVIHTIRLPYPRFNSQRAYTQARSRRV